MRAGDMRPVSGTLSFSQTRTSRASEAEARVRIRAGYAAYVGKVVSLSDENIQSIRSRSSQVCLLTRALPTMPRFTILPSKNQSISQNSSMQYLKTNAKDPSQMPPPAWLYPNVTPKTPHQHRP